MTEHRKATLSALVSAGFLTGMGVLHFVKPKPFDGLIPEALPGSARAWTYGSGVAELAVAGLLAAPQTRRLGGRLATLLYLGVFPGNLKMAWDWRDRPLKSRLIAWGRLPFQALLIRQSEHIHRHA